MKTALASFAVFVFVALVAVSAWATGHIGIGPAISELVGNPSLGINPWFWATLFDAYFGFLWFWLWVAYKESGVVSRLVWLLLILAAGNMAMAAYVLIQLYRLPSGAGLDALIRRQA